jgi:hypothetical protein
MRYFEKKRKEEKAYTVTNVRTDETEYINFKGTAYIRCSLLGYDVA